MDQLTTQLMEHMGSASVGTGDLFQFGLSLIVSIVFGILLQLMYNLYFHDNEPQDGSLARSLVLLTPALTATFWMIQSSLVLSIGLLGSLSFVRFRTPVKRPEDISFIVIGLAVAVACATGAFVIAFALVLMMFVYTLGRNFLWGPGGQIRGRFAIVTFNTAQKTNIREITNALEGLEIKPEFVSSRTYDGITSYVFNAKRVTTDGHDRINLKLSDLDANAHINIFYPNDRLGA